ncbi:MAG: ATP-dependent helicase [Lachnospiraceae bacterium]|nr:ATP-dependent helicase [Lachnospiraceae bacterium]
MNELEFENQYMAHFNEQQRTAVRTTEGAVLLLAVPGSGKTTVLVTRLGYMIYVRGLDPRHILNLTYTVSAARDMTKRYHRLFAALEPNPDTGYPADAGYANGTGYPADAGYAGGMRYPGNGVEFRTINGICAKIILYYGRQLGRESFRLLDSEKERMQLLGALYRELLHEYASESDLHQLSTYITYIKNMMLGEEEILALEKEAGYQVSVLYRQYCEALRARRLMDYDDQLVYALRILQGSEKVRRHFQDLYRYICVDEAQDTSKIQHEIINLLAGDSGNLFMVGDEDQSIYGFRAAYPDALLHFETAHPGAKVLLMEENFRSTGAIVKAASRFIEKNTMRHEKKMHTARDKGSAIGAIAVSSRLSVYRYLLNAAKKLPADETTAVLFRDNESAIPLIDLFERNEVPWRFRNAELSFFSHRVVRDVRDILSFALEPSDTEVFLRIYYKLAAFITKEHATEAAALAERLREEARLESLEEGNAEAPKPVPDLFGLVLAHCELPAKTVESVSAIRRQLQEMREDTPGDALKRITGSIGYMEYLDRAGISGKKIRILYALASREQTIQSFLGRLEELERVIADGGPRRNVQETADSGPDRHVQETADGELQRTAKETAATASAEETYREEAVRAEKESGVEDRNSMILSTIHSSKGLEYDTVYLLDVEDGIFPDSVPNNARSASKEELETYEEERRIFYVGVTRAKKQLYVFRLKGKATFLDDLLLVPGTNQAGGAASYRGGSGIYGSAGPGSRYGGSGAGAGRGLYGGRSRAGYDGNPYEERNSAEYGIGRAAKKTFSESAYQKFAEGLDVGLVVRHKSFGDGVITGMDGELLEIRFGEKTKKMNSRILFGRGLLSTIPN